MKVRYKVVQMRRVEIGDEGKAVLSVDPVRAYTPRSGTTSGVLATHKSVATVAPWSVADVKSGLRWPGMFDYRRDGLLFMHLLGERLSEINVHDPHDMRELVDLMAKGTLLSADTIRVVRQISREVRRDVFRRSRT